MAKDHSRRSNRDEAKSSQRKSTGKRKDNRRNAEGTTSAVTLDKELFEVRSEDLEDGIIESAEDGVRYLEVRRRTSRY